MPKPRGWRSPLQGAFRELSRDVSKLAHSKATFWTMTALFDRYFERTVWDAIMGNLPDRLPSEPSAQGWL